MAILEEMRLLVGDLEATFSRRIEAEQERQVTAMRDAHDRVQGVRELQAAAAEDARARLEEMSRRSSEVADMVESFFHVRMAQTAKDAGDRAKAERERRAEAAEAAQARIAESRELSAIWREHTGVRGTQAPRTPVRSAVPRPPRKAAPAPAVAAKPVAAKPEAPKAAAPKAAAPDSADK
jgi:hypothetical protein